MTLHAASLAGYGDATRATGMPRDVEYRVFSQVTGRLSQALRDDAPFSELAAALHDNARLWTVLSVDLARPENELPEALRAQLISLGIFMRRHTDQVLRGEAEAGVIVDINTAIMRGLRGQLSAAEGA
ncbi:MAG: flagellar biosynthesis regulator FlaF [Pseudomonadota bacterium]